jgi:hypothetical protein
VEEPGAQLLLELRDLVTQRRLYDEAPLGRASEVAELGHGNDIPELLKVHVAIVDHDQSHDNNALDSFAVDAARCLRLKPVPVVTDKREGKLTMTATYTWDDFSTLDGHTQELVYRPTLR